MLQKVEKRLQKGYNKEIQMPRQWFWLLLKGLPIISFDAGLKSAQAITKCRFCRLQEPGRAERDVERIGTRISLEKMLYSGARQWMVALEDKQLLEAIHAGEAASMDNRL